MYDDEKDYKIVKDKYIINNINNIEKNYIDDIDEMYNYKDINKLNYYKNINNFNDLFGRRSTKTGATTPRTQARPSTPSTVTRPTQPSQTIQPTQTTQDTVLQGRAYDASRMWSPTSSAGRIYEWNRGVAAIGINGDVEKEVLDRTANHHADATVRLSANLGVTIEATTAPFEAAINAANNGLVIFQSEGDNAFVYLPETISEEQALALSDILQPRVDFNFSFTHKDEIFEEVKASDVLKFARDLIQIPEMAM